MGVLIAPFLFWGKWLIAGGLRLRRELFCLTRDLLGFSWCKGNGLNGDSRDKGGMGGMRPLGEGKGKGESNGLDGGSFGVEVRMSFVEAPRGEAARDPAKDRPCVGGFGGTREREPFRLRCPSVWWGSRRGA